jgi:hypothetical protein
MSGIVTSLGLRGAFRLYRAHFAHLRIGFLFTLLLYGASSLWASFTGFTGVVSIPNPGSTTLNNPTSIVADSFGNLYIADKANNRIVGLSVTGTPSVPNITGANSIVALVAMAHSYFHIAGEHSYPRSHTASRITTEDYLYD